MIIANHELLQLSHGFFLRCCWPNSLFETSPWLFRILLKWLNCTTTLTINKGESHLDIRSLVLQFSRRCPLSGSQNQRNWDSGNSETSKFLPKCRAGTLCIDCWNKANHHHYHLHPHHPHTPLSRHCLIARACLISKTNISFALWSALGSWSSSLFSSQASRWRCHNVQR